MYINELEGLASVNWTKHPYDPINLLATTRLVEIQGTLRKELLPCKQSNMDLTSSIPCDSQTLSGVIHKLREGETLDHHQVWRKNTLVRTQTDEGIKVK